MQAQDAQIAFRDAAEIGHSNPCTFGSLCPYCEIERLKAEQAAINAGRDDAIEWRDQQIKDLRKYLEDDHAEHKQRVTLIRDWLLTIRVDGPSPRSKWETVKYSGLAAFLKDYPDAYEWIGPSALPSGRVWPD